jgi:hypothetical protein
LKWKTAGISYERRLAMQRLLSLLVLVVIGVVALGYYQGWFVVSKTDSEKSVNVNVAVDKDKINADKERAKEKLQDLSGKAKAGAEKATGTRNDSPAATKTDDRPK